MEGAEHLWCPACVLCCWVLGFFEGQGSFLLCVHALSSIVHPSTFLHRC